LRRTHGASSQAQHERHEQARFQRPEVETHFQQRPDHRAQQHQRIQPQGGALAQERQQTGQQERNADDEVVAAAAEAGQLGAAQVRPAPAMRKTRPVRTGQNGLVTGGEFCMRNPLAFR
jgi:hypothetical protein